MLCVSWLISNYNAEPVPESYIEVIIRMNSIRNVPDSQILHIQIEFLGVLIRDPTKSSPNVRYCVLDRSYQVPTQQRLVLLIRVFISFDCVSGY